MNRQGERNAKQAIGQLEIILRNARVLDRDLLQVNLRTSEVMSAYKELGQFKRELQKLIDGLKQEQVGS